MRALPFIALLAFAFSCKEFTYPEPQPQGKKSLKFLPQELHGKFVTYSNGKPEDTLVISRNGAYNANRPNDASDQIMLGDSLVLKHYKGLYFVNHRNKAKEPNWSVSILKRLQNDDLEILSMPTDEDSFEKLYQSVSAIVPVDSSVRNNEKLYRINPTPKQLMQLVNKGYFSNRLLLKRMK
jgi:hypothetical protein